MPGGNKFQKHAVAAGRGIEHEDGEVFLVGCMTTLESCFNQLVRKERNKKNRNNTSILFYLYI